MIDASIPLQARAPQFESPINQLAKVLQLKGSLQEQELGTMKADEYRRGIADTEKTNALYAAATGADGKVDRNKLLSGMAQGGMGSKLPGVLKSFADADKATADVDKTRVETKAKGFETSAKQLEVAGQAFGYLRQNPTPEALNSTLEVLSASGAIPPEVAQVLRDGAAKNPGGIQAFADQMYRASLASKDQLGKSETQNLGGTSRTSMVDPVSGARTVTGEAPITQSADNAASNATSRANNQATVGASYANAAATRSIAQATRDAAGMQRDQATEMKLADDYRTQSKGFKEVGDAYKQINATLDQATKSPAATLAAATKFMKLLDPGSVVRESELGMALAATGVIDRATNYFQTLQSGRVLTPNQVKDFKNITGQIYQAAQSQQQAIDTNYRKTAETYKLRPETILQDLGQNAKPSSSSIDDLVNKYSK